MTRFYRVPLVDSVFQGIEYADITEGIATQRHADSGFGFVMTEATYNFEEVTEEKFAAERVG